MAVFAPMPSASVSTATAVKPGCFSNWRKAKRRSFMVCWSVEALKREVGSARPFNAPRFTLKRFNASTKSFISQRLHGIDFGGSPCRQRTGQRCDRGQQKSVRRERERVGRAHAEQQGLHRTCQSK